MTVGELIETAFSRAITLLEYGRKFVQDIRAKIAYDRAEIAKYRHQLIHSSGEEARGAYHGLSAYLLAVAVPGTLCIWFVAFMIKSGCFNFLIPQEYVDGVFAFIMLGSIFAIWLTGFVCNFFAPSEKPELT